MLGGALLGVEPEAVWTGTSRHGAPLAGRSEADEARLAVSLTHTNGAVIAAASSDAARLGVDVERLDRTVRAEALARRYFVAEEAAGLAALPARRRREAFLRAWTLKESWGKATGMGVSRALPLVAFAMDDLARGAGPPEPRRGRIAPAAAERFAETETWWFWTLAVGIQSVGLAAGGDGRGGEPSLPHGPASAMIRRLNSVANGPVLIYRLVSPSHGSGTRARRNQKTDKDTAPCFISASC